MFTGIVQAVGKVESLQSLRGDLRLAVDTGKLAAVLKEGDSIAVNGVCLTATKVTEIGFVTDVSTETLSLTTLGSLRENTSVNLESALTTTTPLGGHIMSGHVDGIGEIVGMDNDARSVQFEFAVPESIVRYMAKKGSVAIDGVSLTVNSVTNNKIAVNILPHTIKNTVFTEYALGRQVNIEVDMIARYLERLADTGSLGEGVTWEKLRNHGFINQDGNS
ncbi:MAG: riboflavin synthase [Gammaproteobacteria bacterium]